MLRVEQYILLNSFITAITKYIELTDYTNKQSTMAYLTADQHNQTAALDTQSASNDTMVVGLYGIPGCGKSSSLTIGFIIGGDRFCLI